MIKTFIHNLKQKEQRDKDINLFSLENEIFATQTNTINDDIITTVFFRSKSK